MGVMNGYAQLIVKNGATYVSINPPQEGGKPVDVNEVKDYLDKNLLTEYTLPALKAACLSVTGSEIKVGAAPLHPFNEKMFFRVSPDAMLVFCKFYPASEGGDKMTAESIISELKLNNIIAGFDMDLINGFIQNPVYNTEYMMVKGRPPVHGKDGWIEYFFNTSLNTRPKRNEDGTVNYHELNTVSMVQQGQKLAQLHPAVEGESGEDVYGNPVKPRSVKSPRLEFSNNINISEDKTEIFSNVTGHATLVTGKVFVSDVLEVPADVDTSTGNIEYTGTVMIRGNVKSGFKVKAEGDIIVEGVVEGAELISDGQIIIKRGIHGMTKGVLNAKGNVICKFIENAKVISGGYVETESILHSEVVAFTAIHVSGRKGFVTGGLIRAGKLIEAQIIGSEMGTTTRIEVGTDPNKKGRFVELQKIIAEHRKNEEQIKPILVAYAQKQKEGASFNNEQMDYLKTLAEKYRMLKEVMNADREEYERLHQELMMSEGARIKVSNVIYSGVNLSIGDVSIVTKDSRQYCQFLKQGADIITMNL